MYGLLFMNIEFQNCVYSTLLLQKTNQIYHFLEQWLEQQWQLLGSNPSKPSPLLLQQSNHLQAIPTFKNSKNILLQWCSIKNHQSSIYVLDFHFSRRPDGCSECCHNLALFTHLYHIWELSNEVLYDPVSIGVSKIRQIKLESLLSLSELYEF